MTERNVGGSDYGTRIVASVIVMGLVALAFSFTRVPYSLLKVAFLIAAELGLVTVMVGMFLRAKTYFAGGQLFITPLLMLLCAQYHLPWVAVVIGVSSFVAGLIELVTRRSRVNDLLGVSTWKTAA
jgi:hypothetical protein